MKSMLALIGATLLTLMLAAPAAATQRVQIVEDNPIDFEVEVDLSTYGEDDGWWMPFECSEPIYYGGHYTENLTMWYPDGVAEADMTPAYGAWPFIRGQYRLDGIDYFSSEPGMKGQVAIGKFSWTSHLFDHYLGTLGSTSDLETCKETMTGKTWGIELPGAGTVFHEAGNHRYEWTVVDQGPVNEIDHDP